MAKMRECDRCGFVLLKSQLTYYKGFYFCPDCLDEDYKDPNAILAAPKLKNFNPYLNV